MKKLIVFGLMLIACDKLRSEPSSSTTTATTTVVTATPPSGIVTAADPAVTTLPPPPSASAASGWPAYLPDYPGAKVTKKTKDFESLETKDSGDKVVAFYKDKLKAAGFPPGPWATLGANAKDQATVMTASKGSEMVQVTVTPVQGTTKISLSIM